VTVTAMEEIVITGQNSEGFVSAVRTDTTGQGRGGDIILSAPQVQLTDGAIVSAESAGNGDAGNIRTLLLDSGVLCFDIVQGSQAIFKPLEK
jgi:large exoprotein involved in heme utilization and adhesion